MRSMFPASRRNRQTLMLTHGDAVAWGLRASHTGDPDGRSGWWGALQAAADLSHEDPEMLQIADEIYLHAARLRTPKQLHAYVDQSRSMATTPPAQAFLRGMKVCLDSADDR